MIILIKILIIIIKFKFIGKSMFWFKNNFLNYVIERC